MGEGREVKQAALKKSVKFGPGLLETDELDKILYSRQHLINSFILIWI